VAKRSTKKRKRRLRKKAISLKNHNFVAESIISHKTDNGEQLFLVHWEGFGEEERTWEPKEMIQHLNVYNSYWNGTSLDSPSRCMVCGKPDGEDFLLCDYMDAPEHGGHVHCFKMGCVPDGQWFCESHKSHNKKSLTETEQSSEEKDFETFLKQNFSDFAKKLKSTSISRSMLKTMSKCKDREIYNRWCESLNVKPDLPLLILGLTHGME